MLAVAYMWMVYNEPFVGCGTEESVNLYVATLGRGIFNIEQLVTLNFNIFILEVLAPPVK